MGAPSQCTIVRAMDRSTRDHKVLSRRDRTRNHTIGSQRKKQLYSVSVKPCRQTRKFHAGVRKAAQTCRGQLCASVCGFRRASLPDP